jgi:hypothetical protein
MTSESQSRAVFAPLQRKHLESSAQIRDVAREVYSVILKPTLGKPDWSLSQFCQEGRNLLPFLVRNQVPGQELRSRTS